MNRLTPNAAPVEPRRSPDPGPQGPLHRLPRAAGLGPITAQVRDLVADRSRFESVLTRCDQTLDSASASAPESAPAATRDTLFVGLGDPLTAPLAETRDVRVVSEPRDVPGFRPYDVSVLGDHLRQAVTARVGLPLTSQTVGFTVSESTHARRVHRLPEAVDGVEDLSGHPSLPDGRPFVDGNSTDTLVETVPVERCRQTPVSVRMRCSVSGGVATFTLVE